MKFSTSRNNFKLVSLLLVIGIVFASGCIEQGGEQTTGKSVAITQPPVTTTTSTTTTQPVVMTSTTSVIYHPEHIQSFKGIEEFDRSAYPYVLKYIKFYFALVDENEKNTVGDGKASIEIKDTEGKILFTRNFDFKYSDFIDYYYTTTEQYFGKVYEWKIYATDIQKSMSRMTGTADLTLTTNDGKILKDTYSGFEIPTYTVEELEQIYEQEFLKNAKTVREVITKGYFEVTLVRYGFYTHEDLSSVTSTKLSSFRTDIKVKNIGSEVHCFKDNNAKIISGSNEYDDSIYSNFPLSWVASNCIQPGFLEDGYIAYKDVPHNLTGQIKIIVGTDYEETNSYEFNAQI